jgi:DHA2 family lincomycin resistance protein-like MFS transporter
MRLAFIIGVVLSVAVIITALLLPARAHSSAANVGHGH